MTNAKRPWQGTTLGVLNIIGVVFSFLFAIFFLFAQGMMTSYMTSMPEGSMETAEASAAMSAFAGLGLVFVAIFIASGILGIFLARGAFKGQKWSPIVSLVFAVLGVLGALMNVEIVSIAINGFVGYCAYACVVHPFYNAKKAMAEAHHTETPPAEENK